MQNKSIWIGIAAGILVAVATYLGLQTVVLVVHVLAALSIVGLVLLQHGKGADVGAAFGSGSAGSLFGSAGASNFLSQSTAIAAAVFFAASLGLAFMVTSNKVGGGSVVDRAGTLQKSDTKVDAPVTPPAADAKPDAKGDVKVDTQAPKPAEIPK